MFQRKRVRNLDCTLLVDVKVTEVQSKFRSMLNRQNSSVGIPEDSGFTQRNVTVGPEGVTLEATKGFLFISCGATLTMAMGDKPYIYSTESTEDTETIDLTPTEPVEQPQFSFGIERQFIINGTYPVCTLSSETPQKVSIIQY